MRKIKVLIIHRTLSMLLGGGELFFVRLIRSLTKSNVDIDFITSKPFFRKINCVYKDLNVKYVKSPYLWSLAQIHLSRYIDPLDEYCFKFQLFRFLRKNIRKYDIILVYHYTIIAIILGQGDHIPNILPVRSSTRLSSFSFFELFSIFFRTSLILFSPRTHLSFPKSFILILAIEYLVVIKSSIEFIFE